MNGTPERQPRSVARANFDLPIRMTMAEIDLDQHDADLVDAITSLRAEVRELKQKTVRQNQILVTLGISIFVSILSALIGVLSVI